MDSSDLNILEWDSTSSNNNLSIWDKIIKYYFVDPQYQNYPLTCNNCSIISKLRLNYENVSIFQRDQYLCNGFPYYKDYCNYCDSLLYGEDKGPYKDFVNNYKNNYPKVGWGNDIINFNGETVIKNLFAKAFKVVKRSDDDVYKYEVVKNFDDAEELSKDNNLLAPQIYSLNVERCGQVGSNDCVAYKPNDFTINNVGWDQYDNKEPIVAIGSYSAQVKFFVFADENKMPIKSIKIDWDNDKEGKKSIYNDEIGGFYANRKPYCEVRNHCFVGDEDTQLTCKTNEDCAGISSEAICKDNEKGRLSFGDSARACINNFYSVTYNYVCNANSEKAKSWDGIKNSLTNEEKAVLGAKGYNENNKKAEYCIFKPKIQVRDNWGWCNGNCSQNYKGCYEKNNGCSNDDKAWTPYPGKIIVVAK